MRGSLACSLLAVAVAAACHRGPSAETRAQEVATCTAMSVDTLGTVECLVRLHNWKPDEARVAARVGQRKFDSTQAWKQDSIWRLESAAHQRDIARCQGHDMQQCLTLAGWTDERAKQVTDSIWNRSRDRHTRELADCARRTKVNPASCLMLTYHWDSDRAQAVGDSVMRARMIQRR